MHPLNQKNFGTTGIKVSFYNGTSVVSGYIVKQTATNSFVCTDGSVTAIKTLAPTLAIATDLTDNPSYCTIQVVSPNAAATGAAFVPHYAVQSAAVVSSNGTHWNVSDSLALPSGAGALTVGSVSGGKIATVSVGTAGNYTTLFSSPTTGTRAAGSGATITAHYGVDSATIVAGGAASSAGYAMNDVLTLTGTGSATITVDTVDGGGGILTFHVSAVGTVTSLASNPVATSGGAGTGATFNLKWKLIALTTTGGTGYNIGDTLIFTGITATTQPTASILTVSTGAPATFTISSAGSGITVKASAITTSTTTATFTLGYDLLSVSASGGSGYAVNDALDFVGMTATTLPTAHVSTISTGAATGVAIDSAGTKITVASSSVIVGGAVEYVARIWETRVFTVEGNTYYWALNTSVDGSAFIDAY